MAKQVTRLQKSFTLSTHLIRRHQTWYVRVQIPKKFWAAAGGKRAFVKSLGTRDINEANSRKHQYIAEYKRQIKALQQARHDPLREVRLRALEWRDAIEKAKGETIHLGDEDYEESYDSFLMSEALDEARDVLRAKGEKEAKLFLHIIKSTTPPFDPKRTSWRVQKFVVQSRIPPVF